MTNTIDDKQDLVRFNSQKSITDPYDSGTKNDKKYREIFHHVPNGQTEQDLYLKLRDDKHTWNNLFLGRSKTFEKGQSPERYNIVVPIVPRCYATPDRDPAHAMLPPKGWIYIIRRRKSTKGPMLVELWRELKSDGKGFFRDVHLGENKDQDHRPATGQPGLRIIVPYCIDKEVHELWIAYSEVQWSWARIQSMKKDSKLRNNRMHKLDLSDCFNDFENSRYEKQTAKAPSGGPRVQQEINSVSGPALIYNLKTAPDTFSQMMTDELKDPIPVVYLDNPVGIAKSLGAAYQYACNAMIEYVDVLKIAPQLLQGDPKGDAAEKNDPEKNTAGKNSNKDAAEKDAPTKEDVLKALNVCHAYDPVRWFDSAQILNQFLYARLPDKAPEDWSDEEKTKFPERKQKAAKKFREYRAKIVEEDLKKALRTEERKELRQAMVQTKHWLTQFLKNELVSQGEESALLQALDDYFTLPANIDGAKPTTVKSKTGDKLITIWPDVYADGWKTFTDIIRYLNKHQYAFDGGLEAPTPDGWLERKKDAGMTLLIQIADPEGNLPIHNRLFPKVAKGGKPLEADRTKVENHKPIFKTVHFDALEKGPTFDHALQSMADFPVQFEEVIAMDERNDGAYKQTIVRIQQSLCRLINGVLRSELDEVQVTVDDIIEFKKGTTGGSEDQIDFQTPRRAILSIGAGSEGYFEYANKDLDARRNSRTEIDLTVDSGGPGVTGASPDRNSDYEFESSEVRKTNAAKGDTSHRVTSDVGEEVKLVLKTSGSKKPKVGSRLYRIRAVMILKEEVRQRLANLIGKNKANIEAIGKMFSIVETINLVNAFQTVMNNKNDDKRAKLAAELVSSFCDAAVAVGEAAKMARKVKSPVLGGAVPTAVSRGKDVAKVINKVHVLEVIGHIGSAIDIRLTWDSLVENFRQNDDAYIAEAIRLSGHIILFGAVPLAALFGLTVTTVSGIGFFVILVGLLAMGFIFLNDSHIETWLANGPFALGERDCWNHGVYRQYRKTIIVKDPNGQPVKKECTVHGYNGFSLAVDEDGNLVNVSQGSRNQATHRLRVGDDGKVYLKAGKHPLAKEDTPIGTIGRPYSTHPLLQPQIQGRFMGHTPGADPMSHAQTYRANLRRTGDDPNPDRHDEYRCAMWCEIPHEAFTALMDALFRPYVTTEEVMLSRTNSEVRLHIHTPYLLEKSELFIQYKRTNYSQVAYTPIKYDRSIEEFSIPKGGDEKDPGGAQTGPTLETLRNGDNRFTIRFSKDRDNQCELKVRIDLFGDHTICLPCEPLFCGTDISTDPNGHRWVEFEKVFPEVLLA